MRGKTKFLLQFALLRLLFRGFIRRRRRRRRKKKGLFRLAVTYDLVKSWMLSLDVRVFYVIAENGTFFSSFLRIARFCEYSEVGEADQRLRGSQFRRFHIL